jgi:hypothetical protein
VKTWLGVFLITAILPIFGHAEDLFCQSQQGGWKAICLQDRTQLSDEEVTRVYWSLQKKIDLLAANGRTKEYSKQLSSLLRKNELDYIKYADSYCNMQTSLHDRDTEINKILKCTIKSNELRKQELVRILAILDSSQKEQ